MREHYKCLTTLIKLYTTCICVFPVVRPTVQMYYFSEEDCMDDVQDLPDCGEITSTAFHYNFITKTCEEVPYRGCSPTKNNFDTLEQCNHFAVRICSTIKTFGKKDCHQTPQPCTFGLPRGFQFDVKHQECRPVITGDCSQSKNYFKTMHDCHGIIHLVCNISFEDDSTENEVTTTRPSTTDHIESTTKGPITSTTLRTATVRPSLFQGSFIVQMIKSCVVGHYGKTSFIDQLLQKLLGTSTTNVGECKNLGLEKIILSTGSIIFGIGGFLVRAGLLQLSYILYSVVSLFLEGTKTIILSMRKGSGCDSCHHYRPPAFRKPPVRAGLLQLSYILYSVVSLFLEGTKTIILSMRKGSGCDSCHHYRPPAFRKPPSGSHQTIGWITKVISNMMIKTWITKMNRLLFWSSFKQN